MILLRSAKQGAAVDTVGYHLTLHVAPTDEQVHAQIGEMVRWVRQLTEKIVELA